MKAVILSGGGAEGSYEAGVVAGLCKAGKHFDLVCGTSIGAINGTITAQGDIPMLRTAWGTIAAEQVITLTPIGAKVKQFVEQAEPIVRDGVLR